MESKDGQVLELSTKANSKKEAEENAIEYLKRKDYSMYQYKIINSIKD